MTATIVERIAKQMKLNERSVRNVVTLLQEGNTVPFIARYRKEKTGSLDEVAIKTIEETYEAIQKVEERKEEIIRLIDEQGKLTDPLKQAIMQEQTLARLEDLYRPYKKKRETRGSKAAKRGLTPLAEDVWNGRIRSDVAQSFIDEKNGLETKEDVWQGVRDIIAEQLSDDASVREIVRTIGRKRSMLTSKKKKDATDTNRVYEMYYDYEERLDSVVPHRVLALNRGEKENVLRVQIEFPEDILQKRIAEKVIRHQKGEARRQLEEAIADSLKRLIVPSIERELRNEWTERAEEQAIHIFAENLRSLLLQPPMKDQRVLSIDPAFRTGCKIAIVDAYGTLEKVDVIYPHPTRSAKQHERAVKEAKSKLVDWLRHEAIRLIAIGNGTASRETEQFVATILEEESFSIPYVIVNEAGASVYSASQAARDEFPNLQVEERSAVSIARRIQDPLSEFVKIDPSAIGVGQYQHDVSKKELEQSLSFVVETVVNRVGVDVNVASRSLLQYVSGINETVARNIVAYREENGRFKKRTDLKKVPRLGAKTYEQAIGFLRIPDSPNPLDRTGIHPESYDVAKQLLAELNISLHEIGTEKVQNVLKEEQLKEWKKTYDVGNETLRDIVEQLKQPSRDPRDSFPQPLLRSTVLTMNDLKEGMHLQGTVRNVVDFGAFVDVGVTEDGLVHISKLANRFVKHPLDIVQLGQIVDVWVERVDVDKQRIQLTMIDPAK